MILLLLEIGTIDKKKCKRWYIRIRIYEKKNPKSINKHNLQNKIHMALIYFVGLYFYFYIYLPDLPYSSTSVQSQNFYFEYFGTRLFTWANKILMFKRKTSTISYRKPRFSLYHFEKRLFYASIYSCATIKKKTGKKLFCLTVLELMTLFPH